MDKKELIPPVDSERRRILFGGAGLVASALLLVGCRRRGGEAEGGGGGMKPAESGSRYVGIDGRDYRIAPPQGVARELTIEARPAELEIAPGRVVKAWTYDGKFPGTELRVRQGERLRVVVRNNLPEDTSVHWHGITQRGTNNMDGVPGVTQQPIKPGDTFLYDFVASEAGSYMFHSHSGLQLDRGLSAPLIIEPARETLQYDRDYVVTIDDWLEGSPDDAYAKLKRGEMQGGSAMPGMGSSGEMGKMPGMASEEEKGASNGGKHGEASPSAQMEEGADVNYSTFVINGRAPEAPVEFMTKRGERVRLRLINPSGSTMYRVAVGGHRMTVTHSDGMAVKPIEVETLEIAMGERYDVLINADNPGVWAIVAISTDEPMRGARALLRYSDARGTPEKALPINARPEELNGRRLNYNQLVSAEDETLSTKREPDRRIEVVLGGQMMPYDWTINGKLFAAAEPFEVRAGERVRVSMVNDSLMRHPMHLHGHSFRVLSNGTSAGAPPLKDTAFIEPNKGTLTFEFIADNPGDWLFHCHHAYHMEAGMARIIKYV